MTLNSESEPKTPDVSKLDGARELADKINAYWEARGVKANARPVLMPFSADMREAFYAIRSDLVIRRAGIDALPRKEIVDAIR
jgi:hypothetical protein